MEERRPLLSICIPTYNRAVVLKKTLDSLVQNKAFDETVEVVVSDNNSTDNTQEVGEYYASHYPNIKYYRNKENVRDENFPLSMDRAKGEYIKLLKDNIVMSDSSLEYMRENIINNRQIKTPLFFTNGVVFGVNKKESYKCTDFDDFFVHTSYQITSIVYFGCWREDWERVVDKTRYSELQLSQVDWIFQVLNLKKEALLLNRRYYCMFDVGKGKRTGYNWFKVHVDNYYTIVRKYVESGAISRKALQKEKSINIQGKKAAISTKYFLRIYSSWDFDMSGATAILWKHYKKVPRFYVLMSTIPLWGTFLYVENRFRDMMIQFGWWDTFKRSILRKEV